MKKSLLILVILSLFSSPLSTVLAEKTNNNTLSVINNTISEITIKIQQQENCYNSTEVESINNSIDTENTSNYKNGACILLF